MINLLNIENLSRLFLKRCVKKWVYKKMVFKVTVPVMMDPLPPSFDEGPSTSVAKPPENIPV